MKIVLAADISEKDRELFAGLQCPDLVFADAKSLTEKDLADAEVIIGNIAPRLVESCPHLKWLQLDSAGADRYASLKGDFILTNASGAYGKAIAEHMLACTLSILKKLPEYMEMQRSHGWESLGSVRTIDSLRVLTVGMGDIGSSYAHLMHMLGAEVFGVRRTLRELPSDYEGQYTFANMHEILPTCDVIAMSLPETPETIHIMNEEKLRLMKPGSILINVGRGSAIDTEALIRVQKEHHFSGVYLDVFEHEPLPKNAVIRNVEGVWCTPHISGRFTSTANYSRVVKILYANLQHWLNKEPLEHVVSRKLGY